MKAIIALVASLLFWCAGFRSGAETSMRPNIVVFITDDHSQLDSSVYGTDDVRTPNMRRLADAGMTFTHAFVVSPSCAPSRAALLTGLMPARNSAEPNHSRPRDEIRKLPAYLQELGYEVAAFGKVAHYNQAELYGFDHAAADRWLAEGNIARATEFLESRGNTRPLCLFVGTHEPHVPWSENRGYDPSLLDPRPTHVDTPETRAWRARYYTDVTGADEKLGVIYDLARETLGTNTLFLFTSDHGAQWPFAKWNLYDAGIRVPFIAMWPGVIEPGTRSGAMISWIDLLPTLVEVSGGDPPKAPEEIDGRSFAGVLRGERQEHRDRIFTTHSGDGTWNVYPIRSVRHRDWKYIWNLRPEFEFTTHINLAKPQDGVAYWRSWEAAARHDSRADGTVKRYRQRPREELYDLRRDPHEQRNLADDPSHAARLQTMRVEVAAWMNAQGDEGKVYNEPRLLEARDRSGGATDGD